LHADALVAVRFLLDDATAAPSHAMRPTGEIAISPGTSMSKGHLEFVIRTVCLALGLFAWGGIAHAGTIFKGGLDPTYSNGFAEIDVAATCIISDGFELASNCGEVDFVDASITITDPPTPAFTVTWGFQANGVTGLLWSGGNLLGIDGGPFHSSNPSGLYNLSFDSTTLMASITCQPTETDRVVTLDGVNSTLCADLAGDPAKQEGFQPVPEPGMLVLLLGALGAAWLSRRKLHIV
jgi:hypothetical protein